MGKVTKLQKITPAKDAPKPTPAPELPSEEIEHGTDQNRNCLFVLGYFVFVYAALVAAFWMFGLITHQADRRLTQLHEAQTAAEIRDALAAEFGSPRWLAGLSAPKIPTTEDIIENNAKKIGESISNTVTNTVKDAVTTDIQDGIDAHITQ